MHFRKMLPYAISVCALCVFSIDVSAQHAGTRPRRVFAMVADATPRKSPIAKSTFSSSKFRQLISAAIDERLGSPYQWAGTGPDSYDCSGFVWATFHSVGIGFERVSAATLWQRFLAPPEEKQFEFGTLVFFSGQTHVGIVADEGGFYHASRQRGVVYDEFSDYWVSRIDGFRRVPLGMQHQRAD